MVINEKNEKNEENKEIKIKNIDNILSMLGREIILPCESLIFYHSSMQKFESINTLGTWFSPIKIKEKEYNTNNIYTHNKPLWDNGYDFRFINIKPLKLLSISSYKNDITSYKLQYMINIVNMQQDFIKPLEDDDDQQFLLGQENDPEYLLAYNLCKYSSFDGWITDASYLGFCMLKRECLLKLKLLSVTEPINNSDSNSDSNSNSNITMYYTSKQWKDQFI